MVFTLFRRMTLGQPGLTLIDLAGELARSKTPKHPYMGGFLLTTAWGIRRTTFGGRTGTEPMIGNRP